MSHEELEELKEGQGVALDLEALAAIVVDAGLQVHKALGPGLLEAVYEHCLVQELLSRGIAAARQVQQPVSYKGSVLELGYRLDVLVDGRLIIEVKSVEALTRLHEAQLMTYLKLSDCTLGFLVNFNVELFKHGVRRVVR